jgi:glycosyltransferase involved in cell wall biosynthesis
MKRPTKKIKVSVQKLRTESFNKLFRIATEDKGRLYVIEVLPKKHIKKVDVTCIVAAYNASRFIESSLGSAVKQDFDGNVEILISYDRGTTDDTISKIHQFLKKVELRDNYKIKIILHDYLTPFRDKIFSLEFAEGKYLTFLDFDNLIERNKLRTQIEYLHSHNMHFVFCNLKVIDEQGMLVREKFQRIPKNAGALYRIMFSNYVDLTATMFDRQFYTEYLIPSFNLIEDKFFDDTLEDYFIALVASATNNLNYLDVVLGSYRITTGSVTSHVTDRPDEKWYKRAMTNAVRLQKSLLAFNYVDAKLKLPKHINDITFVNSIDRNYHILMLSFPSGVHVSSKLRLPFRLLRIGLTATFASIKLVVLDLLNRF